MEEQWGEQGAGRVAETGQHLRPSASGSEDDAPVQLTHEDLVRVVGWGSGTASAVGPRAPGLASSTAACRCRCRLRLFLRLTAPLLPTAASRRAAHGRGPPRARRLRPGPADSGPATDRARGSSSRRRGATPRLVRVTRTKRALTRVMRPLRPFTDRECAPAAQAGRGGCRRAFGPASGSRGRRAASGHRISTAARRGFRATAWLDAAGAQVGATCRRRWQGRANRPCRRPASRGGDQPRRRGAAGAARGTGGAASRRPGPWRWRVGRAARASLCRRAAG